MKKIILPLITLIIGIGIGICIPIIEGRLGDDLTIPKSLFAKTLSTQKLTGQAFLTSIRIDSLTAVTMVNKYRNQNDHAWFRKLRTDSGQSLHGFWIPRLILDTILSQTGANGLRIYLGKRTDITSDKRIFSLVLLGTKGNKNNFLGTDDNTDLDSSGDDIYDHVDPCPQACGSLGDN